MELELERMKTAKVQMMKKLKEEKDNQAKLQK